MSSLDWLIARPVAHRGLHDAPSGVIENTSSAFAAAIAAGYAIECDLQITADGEAMVYHDDTLDRLTEGDGRLDAMTSAELKRVMFKSTADRMMTIGELCELVAGRVTLVVELKSSFNGDRRIAARAAAVLAGYRGPAAVMSFDPGHVTAVRTRAPKLPRGIVAAHRSAYPGQESLLMYGRNAVVYCQYVLRARPDFIAYAVNDLPATMPLAARNICGMPLLTWTVRSVEDQQRAKCFADQMIFEGFRP